MVRKFRLRHIKKFLSHKKHPIKYWSFLFHVFGKVLEQILFAECVQHIIARDDIACKYTRTFQS